MRFNFKQQVLAGDYKETAVRSSQKISGDQNVANPGRILVCPQDKNNISI